MNTPALLKQLAALHDKAEAAGKKTFIPDADAAIREQIEYVCLCMKNRAGVRLLMSCMLAKLDNPGLDPRKPYTEIGTKDCFSGRTYDEQILGGFISEKRLPCNATTAFLTPTLRNIDAPLTPKTSFVGRPRELYVKTAQILEHVAKSRIDAKKVLLETLRLLIGVREENRAIIHSLLGAVGKNQGALPLSAEETVTLISQHLACKNTSRLPVLIVAAAYMTAGKNLREHAKPLHSHNAADRQTRAIGDVEICVENDAAIVTAYEMKTKRVTKADIDHALEKIATISPRIHNYIFITTDIIEPDVAAHAKSLYEITNGVEVVVLDCIGFLRHFLHFYHRGRNAYLDAYQQLVLSEPDSAISQSLKQVFLTLRKEAESDT